VLHVGLLVGEALAIHLLHGESIWNYPAFQDAVRLRLRRQLGSSGSDPGLAAGRSSAVLVHRRHVEGAPVGFADRASKGGFQSSHCWLPRRARPVPQRHEKPPRSVVTAEGPVQGVLEACDQPAVNFLTKRVVKELKRVVREWNPGQTLDRMRKTSVPPAGRTAASLMSVLLSLSARFV